MNCYLCSPRKCRPGYLYVVVDDRTNLFKIGCTVNPTARKATYRSNNCTYFDFVHVRRAGCEWTSSRREDEALRRLAKKAAVVRGDWFSGDQADAIEAVEHVCRQVKP